MGSTWWLTGELNNIYYLSIMGMYSEKNGQENVLELFNWLGQNSHSVARIYQQWFTEGTLMQPFNLYAPNFKSQLKDLDDE